MATVFSRFESRSERLRRAARAHALWFGICVTWAVFAAIGTLAAAQSEHGGWMVAAAITTGALIFGALHHASECQRHLRLHDDHMKYFQNTPPGSGDHDHDHGP